MKKIYRTLVAGHFPGGCIKVTWNPKPRRLPDSICREVETFWKREILNTGKKEHIFNGDVCRLDSWSVFEQDLVIVLGYTNYKELLYSNQNAEKLNDTVLSRALGISVVVSSSDDRIIFMFRSDKVGEFPGKLDVFGGHIHPEEHSVQSVPDPLFAIRDEIIEELNLEIPTQSIICIGLIETRLTRKPELIFMAQAEVTAKEILTRAATHNCFEIDRLITVSTDTMESFVATNKENFSPSALGACYLYLDRRN